MGVTYAGVQIENLFLKRAMPVRAQVSSGAVFFTGPEHVVVQLGVDLTEVGSREVVLANGHREVVPMIGPLRVRFGDRDGDLSALVLGDAPLLGAVPMEAMDLAIHPANQTRTVNPASPFIPVPLAK